MNERRTLADAVKPSAVKAPQALTPAERRFVYGEKMPEPPADSRILVSTRIRGEFAKALKRASLQRQLEGVTPNTLQDILEQAIEPWLKANGYLP